ncbi:hypothetical protein Tco_1058436 [Tanacetum coccineum]|uniref:Uncharacterized protein n=1 Tax=Tanacetum coccineum TaxID=301880 RepID=A0ABQ5H917_9ASTR
MKVEESLNVTFDETPPPPKTSPLKDYDLVKEEAIEVNKTRPLGNDVEDKSLESSLEVIPSSKEIKFKCFRLLESKLEEKKNSKL